jgi:hypothetical protein
MFKAFASAIAFSTLSAIAGCGGDSDFNQAASTTLSAPDPDTPSVANLSIGGTFESNVTPAPVYSGNTSRPPVVYRDASTNSLPDAEIAKATLFSIVEFGASYERVRAQNSSLDTSSNEFAQKIVGDLVATVGMGGVAGKSSHGISAKGLLDRVTAEERA